ncbi:MAG TPA: arginine deiminase-related protein [Chitinophagaceae bacterium]|nr:arginine deiminase-related protein [Chitinophagaceae bacterium]
MHIASTILMIRPAAFSFNAETAANNFFQNANDSLSQDELQKKVLLEFDNMVQTLVSHDIEVLVIEDTPEPAKPDAIFPNNWFCTFPSGMISVFPMFAPSRRTEKRDDILQWITENFRASGLNDWSEYEAEGRFLEGTGSMVIDHDNKIIYACLSERTDISVLEKFASSTGYNAITFKATDKHGRPVYHTNVMMCLGDRFAVICEDAIADEMERIAVTQLLESTGHDIITISLEQMHAFAGNMLLLLNMHSDRFLVMSQTAWDSLNKEQRMQLDLFAKPLPIAVPTIEQVEGGSVRCMMAEIFLEGK